VSIQVKLGGRSFSAYNIPVAGKNDTVKFVIDTPRVTLAPQGEFSPNFASEILRLAGKSCLANEQCVCSDLQADVIAIMAIDKNAFASIMEQCGGRALFSSPLLDMCHSEERCLAIDTSDEVCYIRHFDNGLQRAEALEYSTPEDILFFATKWLGESKDTPIYIKSNRETESLLRKYYKLVICE
jgi:hypothetical protein